jgi:hypothetical protein
MDGARAVFFLDGVPRWIIDPTAFAGDPDLRVLSNNPGEIVFSLSGALYPGTQMSADMVCRIRRALGTWICKMELPACGWSGSTDLVSWLAGQSLRFAMSSYLDLFAKDSPLNVQLHGGHAELNASWLLDFEASTLRLPSASRLLRASHTSLRLASSDRHPLLDEPGKGSSLSILRGGHSWGAESELLQRNGWKLKGVSEPFDFLQLDAFESPTRGALISAVFTPAKEGTQYLTLPGALQHMDGAPFALALERPVYAIVADGENSLEATFSAPIARESIAVAPSRALRFAKRIALAADLRTPGAVDRVDAGLQQVYCEQFPADDDTIFDFLVSGNHAGVVNCSNSIPLDDITLRITRPHDFLHLDFTFVNAKLEFRSNLPHLVPQNGRQAIMIVHFPPQHKLEETFEEGPFGVPDGTSPPPVRPVEITLAGPTRLAFDLALGSHGLPLTVENLLAWSNYTMRAPGDTTNLPAPQQDDEHETVIEIPARLFLKSAEHGKTIWNHATFADKGASPQLWHTELQAQKVHLLSAERNNNLVTLTFSGPVSWAAGQTIGILEPVEFAGVFVIKSVDTVHNMLTFAQNGANVGTAPIDVSIANRFVAYSASDYAPPVTSFSWKPPAAGQAGPGTTTLIFAGPVTFKQGDLINVSDAGPILQSCCGPIPTQPTDGILGVFLIATVQGNTLTYSSAKNVSAHPSLFVSMLTAQAISSAAGKIGETSATLTTQIAHCMRVGEDAYVFGTNTSIDGLNLKVVSVTDDGFSLTLGLPAPLTSALSTSTGLIVPVKLYPISQDDRRQIIELDQQPQEPLPLAMNQLILSAIGAWTMFEGNFDPLTAKSTTNRPYDMEKVIYRIAQARDYFVEVDYKGYLWPFGHNATLLKVTKRTFYSVKQNLDPQQNICYLRTQFFVAVREKTRVINTVAGHGQELPFVRVDIDTEITPALFADPTDTNPGSFNACHAEFFWPSLALKQPYSFAMHGYDPAAPSTPVPFSMPLMFVSSDISTATGGSPCPASPPPASLCAVLNEYTADANTAFRTADFGGQSVHFAPSIKIGDTEQHVGSMTFTAQLLNNTGPYDSPASYSNDGEDLIAFRPILDYANVDVPAVRVFTGQPATAAKTPANGGPAALVKVIYAPVYVQNSFGADQKPNPTQIYLQIKDDATLKFPGAQGGGMASPKASMQGLSRNLGNTAKVPPPHPTPADNNFYPSDAFGFKDSTLLGCIKLEDVIAVVSDIGSNLNLLPNLNLDQVFAIANEVTAEIQAEIQTIQADIVAAQKAFATLNNAIETPIQTASKAIQSAMQTKLADKQFPRPLLAVARTTTTINSVQDLYEVYANDLQACLQEMQDDAGCAKVLIQSDLDLLRAAGDINLQTDLLSAASAAANVTEQDCFKKLSQDIVSAALAPLNPLALPAKRIEVTLGNIASAFADVTSTLSVNAVNSVLTQVATLIQQLRDFFANVVGAAAVSPNLYAKYLNTLKGTIEATVAGNVSNLKSNLLKTVNSHFTAFNLVYANYKSCTTVTAAYQAYTSMVPTAQAFLQNAQTMATDAVDVAIDDAIANLISTLATVITPDIVSALSGTIDAIQHVETLYQQVMQAINTPIAVSAHYTLAKIPLQDAPPGSPIFLAHRESGDQLLKSVLEIDANISAQAIPAAPSSVSFDYSTTASITDFSLQLLPGLPFITVQFESFIFTSSKGSGTHSTCKLDSTNPVILGDALGFVAGLESAFGPLAGDGGTGPILQLSGTGIGVGYDFGIPDIEAGGFQIVGLDFSALLMLSFMGDPLKLKFYMARPERHFLMSAGIYGGGGFLGLELTPKGVDDVSGCMEFGATAGLSILFATGEVHIFGGIYFDFGDNRCVLTGFVRAGGSLNVIDILTISVEFYIGLTYENDGGQSYVYGTCTITVTVSVLFFSTDVPLTMQWKWESHNGNSSETNSARLAGNSLAALPAPPVVNPRRWKEDFWKRYTAAFAKE